MQLLKIRFYQLKRDLGILFFPLLALLSCVSFFVFSSQKHIGNYVPVVVFYFFYNFHKNRKDISFIEKHFINPKQQLIVEYQLFLLPFSLPSLFTNYWYCFLLMHLIVSIIPMLKASKTKSLKLLFLPRLFGSDFVFISGIRQTFISLIILIILSLALSPLKLFPLVALFLINSVIYSFYESNESVQILQSSKLSPKNYLNKACMNGVIKISALNLPVLIINSLFNPDMISFNLFFMGFTALSIITVISLKYSNYRYNSISSNFQIKLIIMSFGLFIPYLLPIAILFYYQAKTDASTNLKKYLDDSN